MENETTERASAEVASTDLLAEIVMLKLKIEMLERQKNKLMAKFAHPVLSGLKEGSTNGEAQIALVAAVKAADKSDGASLSSYLIGVSSNEGYRMFYDFMDAIDSVENAIIN